MPTRAPIWASATARLTATVVLPTPPLPLATAMMFLIGTLQLAGDAAVAAHLGVELDRHLLDAGQLHHRGLGLAARSGRAAGRPAWSA